MKFSIWLVAFGFIFQAFADDAAAPKQAIEGWGTGLNPAKDCLFKIDNDKLMITVPGSSQPHDLSSELASTTAPRVLQSIKGDFTMQVKVDGDFSPGEESTEASRTGYTGAGLVVFADDRNFVRLERACLQFRPNEPHPYTNFEIRVDGSLEQAGSTGDFPTPQKKPLWLRLERKGSQMRGAMSQDGVTWKYGAPKELEDDVWNGKTLQVGLAAISTSKNVFTPLFSELSIVAGAKAEEAPPAAKPAEAEAPVAKQTVILELPLSTVHLCENPAEAARRFQAVKVSSTVDVFAMGENKAMRPLAQSVPFRDVGAGSGETGKFSMELTEAEQKAVKEAVEKKELFLMRYIYNGKD